MEINATAVIFVAIQLHYVRRVIIINKSDKLVIHIEYSTFYELFDHLIRVNSFFSFGLELFDEFVCLFLTPFVAHRHEQLFHKFTFDKS
jgi:hypothetical protein